MNEISMIKEFVTAGRAYFTIKSEKTGTRFTYKVSKPRPEEGKPEPKIHFVSVLTGPDNHNNYSYVGIITDSGFRITDKCKLPTGSTSILAFKWFWDNIDHLPDSCKVFHEGRCGRCGRRLTVPESIESGFGPECINLI